MTKTFIDSLEVWDGGKANGYFDFETDEIHVLRGEDQEKRTQRHEEIHASRRNKATFRLAIAAKNLYVIVFFVGTCISLQALQLIGPFFIAFFAYIFLVSCVFYEEYRAEKGVSELGENKRY